MAAERRHDHSLADLLGIGSGDEYPIIFGAFFCHFCDRILKLDVCIVRAKIGLGVSQDALRLDSGDEVKCHGLDVWEHGLATIWRMWLLFTWGFYYYSAAWGADDKLIHGVIN